MTLKRRNPRWEDLDKTSIPLDNLIKYYETFNRTEEKSPRTIAWYTDTLRTFEKFLHRRGGTLLRDAGIQEVRGFILYLQQMNMERGW